jgi:hypothetical protein
MEIFKTLDQLTDKSVEALYSFAKDNIEQRLEPSESMKTQMVVDDLTLKSGGITSALIRLEGVHLGFCAVVKVTEVVLFTGMPDRILDMINEVKLFKDAETTWHKNGGLTHE